MILTVCSNADLLSVMVIVRKILDILQIVAPIALIIATMISLLKAVISNDQSGIAKNKSAIPKKFLAVIIIILVPTILEMVMRVAAPSFEYASCFDNATTEYVQQAYVSNAYVAVSKAEETKKPLDYDEAKLLVNKIKDEEQKKELQERLNVVKEEYEEEKKRQEEERRKEQIKSSNDKSYNSTGEYTDGAVTFKDSNIITTTALKYLGVRYIYGGKDPNYGLDCSGLVTVVLKEHGLPGGTIQRARDFKDDGCTVSNISNAKAGDLLIYGTRHIAIYLGEDTNGTKWRVHASGDQSCPTSNPNPNPGTKCKVKKDTNVMALKPGETLTIKRVMGDC